MSQENSSRRSHGKLSRKAQWALLGSSILVFLAGSATLCWAIGQASGPGLQMGPPAAQQQADGEESKTKENPGAEGRDPSDGTDAEELESAPGSLVSPQELSTDEEESPTSKGDNAAPSQKTGRKSVGADKANRHKTTSKGSKATAGKPKTRKKRRAKTRPHETQKKTGAVNSKAPVSAASSTRTGKTFKVHHTAYSKVTIYRVVKHSASATIENEDGRGSPTKTTCPICGKVHEQDFNERLFDHVEEHLCKACGKKHPKAYTEIVRR